MTIKPITEMTEEEVLAHVATLRENRLKASIKPVKQPGRPSKRESTLNTASGQFKDTLGDILAGKYDEDESDI